MPGSISGSAMSVGLVPVEYGLRGTAVLCHGTANGLRMAANLAGAGAAKCYAAETCVAKTREECRGIIEELQTLNAQPVPD